MSSWRKSTVPDLLRLASPDLHAWKKQVHDGTLAVFVGPEPGGFHLSISHKNPDGTPGRYPTWDEIHEARYKFCPDNATMAMLLPPKDEYVNVHSTTFHLWQLDA